MAAEIASAEKEQQPNASWAWGEHPSAKKSTRRGNLGKVFGEGAISRYPTHGDALVGLVNPGVNVMGEKISLSMDDLLSLKGQRDGKSQYQG
jgi:hypothetical protein